MLAPSTHQSPALSTLPTPRKNKFNRWSYCRSNRVDTLGGSCMNLESSSKSSRHIPFRSAPSFAIPGAVLCSSCANQSARASICAPVNADHWAQIRVPTWRAACRQMSNISVEALSFSVSKEQGYSCTDQTGGKPSTLSSPKMKRMCSGGGDWRASSSISPIAGCGGQTRNLLRLKKKQQRYI